MKTYFYILLAGLFLNSCKSSSSGNPVIKNKDVQIVYNLAGTGDTAIVFVHGWSINKEYWSGQQEYFSPRFTTVALDLGGHGQSGKNRDSWTVNDYADDVMAVITGLKLKKIILVGHSMSGDICMVVANKIPDPVVGFVGVDNTKDLVDSFSTEEKKNIDLFFQSIRANYDTVVAGYVYGSLFPHGYKDSVSMKRVVHDVQAMDSTISIKTLEGLIPVTLQEKALISGLRVPVYLIVSADMGPVHDSTVRNYCKNGLYIKTMNGVGHYPMIERPTEFNRLLEEIISDIGKK